MADGLSMGRNNPPPIEQQIVFNIEGMKELEKLSEALNRIARGNNIQDYWKSQEELVNDVIHYYNQYQRTLNNIDATNLINTLNALRAVMEQGTDFGDLIPNYDRMLPTLDRIKSKFGEVIKEMSPEAFSGAFSSFELLKGSGLEVEKILSTLASSGDVSKLINEVAILREKLAEALSELEGYKSGDEITNLENRIESLTNKVGDFEATAERARTEFENFLSVHDINWRFLNDKWLDDPYEGSITYTDRIRGLFEEIQTGQTTAQEAIAEVRSRMSDLFQQASSYGVVDVQRLSESVGVTNQQTAAFQNMAESTDGIKAVGEALATIINGLDGAADTEDRVQSLQQSLLPLLEALKELSSVDLRNLDSVGTALSSLRKLGEVKGGNKSLQGLVAILRMLSGKDVDISKLAILSAVKLDGFKDVKVSKTILYIGELTKNLKNVDALERLSNMQFENLKKIKIDKSAISSIRDLAEAIKVLREAKAASVTVTDESIAIEEGEASRAKKEAEYLREATQALRDYYGMLKQLQAGFASGAIIGDEAGGYHTDSSEYAERVTQLNQYLAKKRELVDEVDREAHKEETLITLTNRELALNNQVLAAKEVATNKQVALSEKQEAAANKQAAAEQQTLLKAIELQSRYSLLIGKMSSKKHGAFYTSAVEDRQELDNLIQSFQNGGVELDDFKRRLQILTTSFNTTKDAVNGMSNSTMTAFQRLATMAKKFSYWFSVTRIVMAAYRAFKQMVQSSIELESTFNQLQIVTGATDAEMSKFADTAINLAKGLGQSVTDVTKAIETFSRLGYTLSEAGSLAEFATILSNVANVDLSAATTGLTSIIKGFDMEVSDAEHVSDVLINVGQKFAVSASEMMDAYERAGAALNATNTSFEKSAALIAAANASVDFCRAA